ncbi:MAG: glycosyltransferase family 4 protein [Thermoleophilaceae bacterium]|nr:glycosyltransferase family 4 protein [Thermoleophilaceae bacterium]
MRGRERSDGAGPRIGLVVGGDAENPAAWSGVPAGVLGGLREAGVEVVPVRAALSPRLGRVTLRALTLRHTRLGLGSPRARIAAGRRFAVVSPQMVALRGRAVRANLRRAGGLDGLVQVGTEYVLPAGPPTVTLEDQTVPQARASAYSFLHRLPPALAEDWLERQLLAYRRAVACCVTTHWAARSVIDDYGIAPEKVRVVGVGRNFSPRGGRRDWSIPRFLFIAAEWERKNGPGLLSAFARLHAELPSARLDLVGNHPPPTLPGVTGHGRLRLGVAAERERLEELYRRCTCLVMPSWHEPAGIAYADAAAGGMPSIGTSRGGSADIIGDAGMIVDPADDDALLDALRAMADPERASRLGELARRRAAAFSWPLVAERLLRALALPGLELEPLADFL